MILYHGSTTDIKVINLACSRPNKDFGKGFYLSEDKEQAQLMAEYKAEQLDGEPVINAFEFDGRVLAESSLHVKMFYSYDEEWAKFVFLNRNNASDRQIHDYDIVYGPIANDRIGLQMRKYIEKEIDFKTFVENIKYIKGITFQYFFGTEKAINLLKKL